MIRDRYNIIPFTLAIVLHGLVFSSLFYAWEFTSREQIVIPSLAITATLVTDDTIPERRPEPIPEPVIEPEPVEPEPEIIEPEVPDTSEQDRLRAEEEAKRLEDARIEQERRDRERQIQEEADRKAREEAELEERREEAERIRQLEEDQQRERNRIEQEQINDERQAAIDAEATEIAALNSDDALVYYARIGRKVTSSWIRPATAPDNLECRVKIRQLANGEVTSVSVLSCNGDEVLKRSVEAAVRRASPLPLPRNPVLFNREFIFVFVVQE